MGKVIVSVKLWNFEDELDWWRGRKSKEEIRTVETQGLGDRGATMVSLPEEIVEELGLLVVKEIPVRYAGGQKEIRKIATGLKIEILSRDALTDCIVEKQGTKVFIGQIPIEEMDLLVVPKNGTIGPRLESPDVPLIEMFWKG